MLNSSLFLFGPYVLDPNAGLFHSDRRIAVPPKELALLALLVRNQGHIVSHREIEEQIWPSQIVSYTSLARCVYSLRQILDANGKNYIDTVHKQGYRFAVPVKRFEPSGTESALTQSISHIPLAYSHYAAGIREANDPRAAAQQRAILLFEEAARVDPKFAAAIAAVADTRMYQVVRGDLLPAEGLNLGLDASQRALEVNPNLVQAMAVLAWFKGVMLREFEVAHALLDTALALDSTYARAYAYRSWIFRQQGCPHESATAAKMSVDVDPHALLNRHCHSWSLFCSDGAEDALAIEQNMQMAYPLDDVAHGYTAIFAAYLGRYEEALAASKVAMQLASSSPAVCAAAAYAMAAAGETEQARDIAENALEAVIPRAPKPMLAPVYLELDDPERALSLLREACEEGCAWSASAQLDPRLSVLKAEPDFLSLFS